MNTDIIVYGVTFNIFKEIPSKKLIGIYTKKLRVYVDVVTANVLHNVLGSMNTIV